MYLLSKLTLIVVLMALFVQDILTKVQAKAVKKEVKSGAVESGKGKKGKVV